MNITTIIELENREVEEMAGAKLVFKESRSGDNIVETCVECFKGDKTEECIPTEEAMQKVFDRLQQEGIIPSDVEDFSYETPSCERYKKKTVKEQDMPEKVIISFML
jgi:hypothetical protein